MTFNGHSVRFGCLVVVVVVVYFSKIFDELRQRGAAWNVHCSFLELLTIFLWIFPG